ncbi:MAG TPA: tRNA-dihydrouridine synthase, partial [Kiloniellaceae bacterium]|nr:tRNA-dihydrouridine synthase [Kiloniellaceae bacterium]
MLEHYEALLTLYGRHTGVRVARKHLGWYAKGIDGAAGFRARVNTEDDPARVKQMIAALFASALEGGAPAREAA